MTLHSNVRKQLLDSIQQNSTDEAVLLNDGLRLLSKWRSQLLQNTIAKLNGLQVIEGPFVGMQLFGSSKEGCHVPRLLGCYEQPLLPFIEEAIQANYPTILNVGCAEGYYAVGMARRMPNTKVLAFDLNPKAQETCAALAAKNNVSDRITIGALFKPEDFANYAGQKVLVLCDIEGAEKELLNPELAPTLKGMDIIMESHECLIPGITQEIITRFKDSHTITLVEDNGQRQLQNAPKWFNNLAHLDQLLATWEWRSGATPWLVMKANKP